MILTIEILPIEKDLLPLAENAVLILNENQEAFHFDIINDENFITKIPDSSRLYTGDVFNELDNLRMELRGYHPHILCLTNRFLKNNKLSNLFGDLQRSKEMPTGNGIFTTYEVKEIIKEIPIEIYIIYELLLCSILFLTRKQLYHPEQRCCPFDLKIKKQIMYEVLRYSNFCLPCTNLIRRYVDKAQLESIRKTLNLISDVSHAENPENELKGLVHTIKSQKNEKEKVAGLESIRRLVQRNELENAIEELSLLIQEILPERNNEGRSWDLCPCSEVK